MLSALYAAGIVGISNLFAMNKFLLLLLVSAAALTGCSRTYVIKLTNGMKVTTASKPKLKHGYYTFKDAAGNENRVPQSRVAEIEPASMAAEEKNQFKPPPPK